MIITAIGGSRARWAQTVYVGKLENQEHNGYRLCMSVSWRIKDTMGIDCVRGKLENNS